MWNADDDDAASDASKHHDLSIISISNVIDTNTYVYDDDNDDDDDQDSLIRKKFFFHLKIKWMNERIRYCIEFYHFISLKKNFFFNFAPSFFSCRIL